MKEKAKVQPRGSKCNWRGTKIIAYVSTYEKTKTHKCPEQNFELRTVSSLGAVMSNPTHIHTLFPRSVCLGIWSCIVKKPPIDTLTAVDASRLL